jgi:hypothetical protein
LSPKAPSIEVKETEYLEVKETGFLVTTSGDQIVIQCSRGRERERERGRERIFLDNQEVTTVDKLPVV